MAETTQEKKTFKWGDNEYLLDDLLRIHSEQEQNYYNFARERGKYNDDALAGLKTAVTNRINAAKDGRAFMADGALDDDAVDNVFIPDEKKRKAKKGVGTNQDNTEWSKYYITQLVGQLNPYTKKATADKGDWDLNKHGFGAYLTNEHAMDAQEIFQNYDLRDENNPEATRSFTQRHDILRKRLGDYRNWLQTKNFDFTKNDNEWDDNFMTTLNDLIDNQDWSDSTALAASLRKLGAGNFVKSFTSDRWNLNMSNEEFEAERKAAADKKKKEDETKQYQLYIRDTHGAFKALSDNNFGGTYFTSKGDGLFQLSDEEYEKWLNTHTKDGDAYMKSLQENYYKNPFNTTVAGEYLPLADRFGALKEVTIDGRTFKYDPKTIDRSKNRFVAFDPESGEIRHAFIGDIESEKEALRRQWRIKNGYDEEASAYFENGGVISMQTGGGFNLAQAVNRDLDARNAARAAETGNSEEVQKARDRVVSNGDKSFRSEKDTIAQPDAGFTGAERARLASIGMDITSVFLDPISGLATGAASSMVNFGADVADDGLLWLDVKNLGINLGFDLLGAIPIFGDAFGTGAKITKNLIKWAPRAMAGMAAFLGMKNFDGMMESWGKLTSGDKDQKLTVQDWRNIAQSISLLTGGIRAGRNKVNQMDMKKQAKVNDAVGVTVRNNKTGKLEQVIVNGDVAKKINSVKNSKADVEAELNKFEEFKGKFESGDYEVATDFGGLQNPWRKREVDGKTTREYDGFFSEGAAKVSDVYDFSKVRGYNEGWGVKLPSRPVGTYLGAKHVGATTWLNRKLTPKSKDLRMSDADIDVKVAELMAPINKETANLKSSMSARNTRTKEVSKELAATRAKADSYRSKLKGVPDDATLLASKTKQEADLAAIELQIVDKQKLLQQAESELTKLQSASTHKMKRSKLAKHNAKLASLRGDVAKHKTDLQKYEHTKSTGIVALDALDQQLKMRAELPSIEANVQRLEGIHKSLNKSNATHAKQRLEKLIADYRANHSNIGGRSVDWDMAKILSDAGIKGAFKQGGSIDRSKINKFLTYAKR